MSDFLSRMSELARVARETMPPKPRRWRSVAVWPASVTGLGNIQNESTDEHETESKAQFICGMLRRQGLGGEGKIFPLSTRVEPIE